MSNYGWFIGLCLSLVAIIVISVFIWWVHKHGRMTVCVTLYMDIYFLFFSAMARDIASNYGWFIGLCLSLVAILVISVFIWWVHKQRKDVEEVGGGSK